MCWEKKKVICTEKVVKNQDLYQYIFENVLLEQSANVISTLLFCFLDLDMLSCAQYILENLNMGALANCNTFSAAMGFQKNVIHSRIDPEYVNRMPSWVCVI